MIASYPIGAAWHAFRTEIKAEVKAKSEIEKLGFETFIPMERRIIIRRRRKHQIDCPLFSRYGFVKFDVEKDPWGQIKSTDGVEDILTNNQLPVRVPTPQIERLKLAEKFGLFDRTKKPNPFPPGTDIEIAEGPFAGFIGKVLRARSGERVDILLNMFGSNREIEFPLLHIRANRI